MRTFVRLARQLTFAIAALGALSGMPAHAQGTPQSGGTLVMVVQPEPPTLASYQSTAGPVGQVTTKVYEGLLGIRLQPQADPRPGEVLDGKRRRQDHHLQAAAGREVPRRQGSSPAPTCSSP